jgi:hypothetical protein
VLLLCWISRNFIWYERFGLAFALHLRNGVSANFL